MPAQGKFDTPRAAKQRTFMRNGFAKIRSGLEEHLIAGRIGFFEAGVYLTIHLQADFRRGVWIGSAPRLLATGPRGASLRSVQRALERLAEIGFLRSFHDHGARGNYTVLIHKYEPQFGALRGTRLNALVSPDWSHPIYERVAESDAVPVAEHDAEDAPSQDSVFTTQDPLKPSSSEAGASDPASRGGSESHNRTPKAKPSERGQRLARLLQDRILSNNPNARIPDKQFEAWARVADLIVRIDKRTEQQIAELIEWSQQDAFWKTNILSMDKLRQKFDQLTLKSQSGGTNGIDRRNGKPTGALPTPPGKYADHRTVVVKT